MTLTDSTETAAQPSPAALASDARRQLRPPVPAAAEMRDAGLAAPAVGDETVPADGGAGLAEAVPADGGAGLAEAEPADGGAGRDEGDAAGTGPRSAPDAGMNTAEYAVGTLAAVAFAGILLKVLTSDSVQAALAGVIQRALG
ncbi:hypothetical protein GCM10009679_37410 [Saccharothrix algeriensis]|uniref:DUF4244 domain-containing protein n=1 Tax=Catellatospora bangladeshensis TaxID=310355 RepID=A0A8J3NIT1_9ACTN|nr:hypothetical protein Cba03nite_38010 [Catellatospora bangladeshensis]